MYPFISIGEIKYSSYNLCILIGIIIAILLFVKFEKNINSKDKEDFLTILGILLVIAFLGAFILDKFNHFTTWEDFKDNFFKPTGLTFYGGVISSFIGFNLIYYILYKSFKKNFITLNSITPYFIIGQIFGRIGCFLGGCCYGYPTDSVIGIAFPINSFAYLQYGNVKVLPTQLFEVVLLLGILSMTLIKGNFKFRIFIYLIVYSIGRFIIEYFRGDNRGNMIFIFSPSQLICVIILIISVIAYLLIKRSKQFT